MRMAVCLEDGLGLSGDRRMRDTPTELSVVNLYMFLRKLNLKLADVARYLPFLSMCAQQRVRCVIL